MLADEGARGCLALELPLATAGPAGEELLEDFLVGGQLYLKQYAGCLSHSHAHSPQRQLTPAPRAH